MQVLGWVMAATSAMLATPGAAHSAPQRSEAGYALSGTCAGYPRVSLTVPAGHCAGLVADATDGLHMPRRILEVAPGRFWITDMGNWEPNRGRLLELDTREGSARPRLRTLASRLDRPHGLVTGPDGQVYVGEAGKVWRTPVGDKVQPETVLDGLPADGAHPLKELAFLKDGRLLVNVGSSSDACLDRQDRPVTPCPDRQGPRPRAAVYATPPLTARTLPLRGLSPLTPYATGLRNSLGLAVHPTSGQVWQAENSVDAPDERWPAEELNRLQPGQDHGWPECVTDERGRSVTTQRSRPDPARRCAALPGPFQALRAHTAPLQLMFTPSTPNRPGSGRLLGVWHGYRAAGHRIVMWPLDAQGEPSGPPVDRVSGWDFQAGVRPLGSPAGVTVDRQGRLWIVEDRNHTVLIVAPQGRPPLNPPGW